jgi:tRNA (guanine-N7-)-methyltransferase
MRLRNVKGAREDIEKNPYVIKDAEERKGKWHELFGNDHPIHLEIGMGKGQFLLQLAEQNPNINYIGIEKFSSVLIRALQKREEYEGDNIYFLRMDAEHLEEIFAEEEIARIYLNFSDPWPKERHAKRRLTSKEFFARYHHVLNKNGKVIFKTDNTDLFDFSLEQIPEAGWKLENYTYDLHNSEYAKGNVMTEYEAKFSAEGKPICRLVAYR